MLKISKVGKANQHFTLKLEGRVVGPWVHALRSICESLLNKGRGLKLDLAGVSYVDADGVSVLMSFKSRGVALNNCSPFVNEQLKSSMEN
jgi:ABC-type transporter Mla MlaB component